jgi:hypothetical protein
MFELVIMLNQHPYTFSYCVLLSYLSFYFLIIFLSTTVDFLVNKMSHFTSSFKCAVIDNFPIT